MVRWCGGAVVFARKAWILRFFKKSRQGGGVRGARAAGSVAFGRFVSLRACSLCSLVRFGLAGGGTALASAPFGRRSLVAVPLGARAVALSPALRPPRFASLPAVGALARALALRVFASHSAFAPSSLLLACSFPRHFALASLAGLCAPRRSAPLRSLRSLSRRTVPPAPLPPALIS